MFKCFPEILLVNEVQTHVNHLLAHGEHQTFESLKTVKKLIVQLKKSLEWNYESLSSQMKQADNEPCSTADEDDDADQQQQQALSSEAKSPKSKRVLANPFYKRSSLIDCMLSSKQQQLRSFSLKNSLITQHTAPTGSLGTEMFANPNDRAEQGDLDLFKRNFSKHDYDDEDEDNIASVSLNSNVSNPSKTSDYESGESPNSDSDSDKLKVSSGKSAASIWKCFYLFVFEKEQQHACKRLEEIKEELFNSLGHKNRGQGSSESQLVEWNEADLKGIELLNYLHDWNFPIFELYEKSQQNILSQVICPEKLFKSYLYEL